MVQSDDFMGLHIHSVGNHSPEAMVATVASVLKPMIERRLANGFCINGKQKSG